MDEKLEILNKKGFIAALDQSSGSSEKALKNYGIEESRYRKEIEKFNIMHQMRERVITNENFTNEKIIGVILYEEEINKKINGEYTPDYLWNQKKITSFVKIDDGLLEREDGVCLMKDIKHLDEKIKKAKSHGIIGTKMRSVIYENNKDGITKLVSQQFELAKIIYLKGLIPIVEPEVNIDAKDKEKCEKTLVKQLDRQLKNIDFKIILKLTLPERPNIYKKYTNNPNVLKVIALSGGYKRDYACKKLSQNINVIASFSKALLQDLRETQTDEQFSSVLKRTIDEIYEASISWKGDNINKEKLQKSYQSKPRIKLLKKDKTIQNIKDKLKHPFKN